MSLPNASSPVVGMIVPPREGAVPPEGPSLYGDNIQFLAAGLGLGKLTPEGYDSVIDRVADLSAELVASGAQGVSLMGTSLSFYRGPAFNERLLKVMRRATGVPVTTMSSSVLEALDQVSATRIAIATPYITEVNQRLEAFLQEYGIQVTCLNALELEDVNEILAVTDETLLSLGRNALKRASGEVDALFFSCGGLHTESVALELEQEAGLPVISSALAGAWGAVRLVGHDGTSQRGGALFQPT